MTDPVYLEPLNKSEALRVQEEVEALLGQISTHELKLARSYARLGSKIKEVKVNQFWMALGYDRFSSYLEYVRNKIGRERSQLYAILSVAETLLPVISEEKLEEIGITKSHELKRLIKQGGNVSAEILDPDDQTEDSVGTVRLMDYAARPRVTAAQLRVKVNELLHIHEPAQGNWIDLGGFYATADERKEIEDFWGLGRKLLVPEDESPDHVWKKTVFLDGVREALGTWMAEASDGR